MRNMDSNSSVERMKQLMNHGSEDAALRSNISETVEHKVEGPNGKTYGIVRESQKYFIKESTNGTEFNYIGGIGNRSENEYPSYNSAQRNLELKLREMSASLNTGKLFETFKPAVQAEYIVEATEDMRKELDRFKQITNGAQNIMKESSTEFINKPTFKDPEGFGTATDPKKQGAPFTDEAKATLDKDPKASTKTAKTAGAPFEGDVKVDPTKFDIEKTSKTPASLGDPFNQPAKDVLGNSVATQKPKGGKVIKVTESQMAQVRKYLSEGLYDDDASDDLYIPNDTDLGGEDEDENYDFPELDDDDDYGLGNEGGLAFQIPTQVTYNGPIEKLQGKVFDYVGQKGNESYLSYNGTELSKTVPTEYLEKVGLQESVEEDSLDEGLWDTIKGIGSVGKHFGGQAAQGIKQGAQNAYGAAKQGVQNAGQAVSKVYNQSQAQSSQGHIDKIADNLKSELINLNSRTVKAGGQPLNYNSVLTSLSNKLRGQLRNVSNESVDGSMNDDLVNEITEAVLNAFGQHPTYQKPAFTTPAGNGSLVKGTKEWDDASAKGQAPYGTKIGSSAPFTQSVKQKVGEGEIAEDADSVQQGKTPQGKPNLGQKGDKAPFTKPVQNSGDKIAKGTPVQKGETQQAKPALGKKGDTAPFNKTPKKTGGLNEISGALANRASDVAYERGNELGNKGDSIGANIKDRQGRKFGEYVNPELEKYAASNGIKIHSRGGITYISLTNPHGNTVDIRVNNNGSYEFVGGTLSNIPFDKQKVISNLIKKIKQDSTPQPRNTPPSGDVALESKKASVLNKLAESIIADLKKKS